MEIVFTRNIVEYLERLRENFLRSSRIGMLEAKFNGSMLRNSVSSSPLKCEEEFKQLIMRETGFIESEFAMTVRPLKILNGEEFMRNPYLSNIVLDDYTDGNIRLYKDVCHEGELMAFDQSLQDAELSKKFQFAVFDRDVTSYFLEESGAPWMSITPAEVETMKLSVRNAKGSLLVLGGGLGYFPYMCSIKDNISFITIVEKDPAIKKMLESLIIPQFPRNMTMIIEADAYEFMEGGISGYDSVFADIWENSLYGAEPYAKLVKYEMKYPDIHFDYWLEDSILDSKVAETHMYFLSKMDPATEEGYAAQYPASYAYLENTLGRIERPAQIQQCLNRRFAKNMLKVIGKVAQD